MLYSPYDLQDKSKCHSVQVTGIEVDLLMYEIKIEDDILNLFFEKELKYEYQEENDDDFEW